MFAISNRLNNILYCNKHFYKFHNCITLSSTAGDVHILVLWQNLVKLSVTDFAVSGTTLTMVSVKVAVIANITWFHRCCYCICWYTSQNSQSCKRFNGEHDIRFHKCESTSSIKFFRLTGGEKQEEYKI